MEMRRLMMLIGLAALGAAAGCGPGSSAGIDPEADRLLKAMSDTLTQAESFSFHGAGVMDEVLETGQLSQFHRSSKVHVARPNKLFAETIGDDIKRSAWYDGRTLTVLDRRVNEYATIQVPNTIEKMMDFVVDKYGLTVPVADLLFRKPYDVLIQNVVSGRYVSLHSVGEHSCHHLAFRQEVIDWQIWIDAGKTPLPRKLVITHKLEKGHPQYMVVLPKWDLSAEHPDGMFLFQPPAGSKRIEMRQLLGVD